MLTGEDDLPVSSNGVATIPNFAITSTIALGLQFSLVALNLCLFRGVRSTELLTDVVSLTAFSVAMWLALKHPLSNEIGRSFLVAFLFQNFVSLLSNAYSVATVCSINSFEAKVKWITLIARSLCIVSGIWAIGRLCVSGEM